MHSHHHSQALISSLKLSSLSSLKLSSLSSSSLSHLPAHTVTVLAVPVTVADPCHPSPRRHRLSSSHLSHQAPISLISQPMPSSSQPTPPSPPHSANPRLRLVLRSDPRHLSILFAMIEFVFFFFFFFFFLNVFSYGFGGCGGGG